MREVLVLAPDLRRLRGASRSLSRDHDDGVEAARSRDDAIDATAVSLTRRDGPDAVRNSSNSNEKPPPASCDGHESHELHDGTPRAHQLERVRDVDPLREVLHVFPV